MAQHDFALSPNANLRIYDDDSGQVYFSIQAMEGDGSEENYGTVISHDVPWAFTANGVREGWRSGSVYRTYNHQLLGSAWVAASQTITFHLGESNVEVLGEPRDFSVFIYRSDMLSVARITDGAATKRSIPYVKDNGVWRLAEAYAKRAGTWKQTI